MRTRTPQILLLIVALVVALIGLPRTATAQVARSQISQFGVTWTFDKDYPTGQFATGDYWVVGPVRIVKIDPPSVSGGRVKNGSQINPSPRAGTRQGYDSAAANLTYDQGLNVGLDVSAAKPLDVPVDSSLVSTISIDKAGNRPQLQGASILTVLSKPASAGDFRPPFCGKDKTVKFNENQLDYSRLLNLQSVGNRPSLASVERLVERPWFEHIGGWVGKYIHPEDNLHYYGRNLATHAGIVSLMVHLDIPVARKRNMVVGLVQMGIDKQGIADDGGNRNWTEQGGHNQGRKWPILFAGLMLGDPHMTSIGTQSVLFQEDMQTFYITQADIQRVGFAQSDLGKPMWGQWHTTRPERDKLWGVDPYQMCCTANSMHGQLLAALLMGAKPLWNHDATFDYQDRYVERTRKDKNASWEQSWDGWCLSMWNAYRGTVDSSLRLSYGLRVASAYDKPTGMHATRPHPAEVRLRWTEPKVAASSYRLYRGTDSASLKVLGDELSERYYTDPSVPVGQIWYYAVSAVDAGGKELLRSSTIKVQL